MDAGDEADVNVSWADQSKINTFSRLNGRLDALEAKYAQKKKEKEDLDDLASELELCDDDEIIKYRVGDVYVNAPYERVQEWIQRDQSALDMQVAKLKDDMDAIVIEMDSLKAVLYKRFGNAINLERS
ncbi:Prefoldin beta-like protein [Catenaria anguillulae PL171]|uniref:Prefoldin subunit 4 n=1 Tax=Catenaria anguillulae PL171 TaxID=765915 RepID=A0A1Y2HNG5_9FUNG|nr:Prefoldin beta-like protein [Catenaria anguillulae PL171]